MVSLFCYLCTATDVALTALAFAVTAPAWLLREFGRRLLFAHLRVPAVLAMSLVYVSVHLTLLLLLASYQQLSARTAVLALGIASALAGAGWLWLDRCAFRWQRRATVYAIRKNWVLGRWILAGQATSICGAHSMPWLVAAWLGPAATGLFAACDAILRFANPLIVGLTNVLTPRAAVGLHRGGHRELRRIVRKATLLLAAALAIFCLVLAVAGEWLLRVSFGEAYAAYWATLCVLGCNQLVAKLALAPGRGLLVLKRADLAWKAEVAGLIGSLFPALLLLPMYGVLGAALALLVGSCAKSSVIAVAYSRLMASTRDQVDDRITPRAATPRAVSALSPRQPVRPHTILVCHTFYQQAGGEDQSFRDEVALLRERGHRVIEYTRHNDELDERSRLRVARDAIWNRATYAELRALIRRERPALLHCTNIFPTISPAAYQAAADEGIPVVQSLRNYRFMCPSFSLLRGGQICETCIGKSMPWPAVVHACYRDSRFGSAAVAAMIGVHNVRGTWHHVDRYYTLTHFARDKFIAGGFPADRIDVKPNFVSPDLGPGAGDGGYAMFAGRLSMEKGIETLLEAWTRIEADIPLLVIGDGPARRLVTSAAASDHRIRWLGQQSLGEVYRQLRGARCLVMPSVWYETFGRTIIEAFAAGTPVIASRLGAMQEIVSHGETGLLFRPGSAEDLASAVNTFWSASHVSMRRCARQQFEDKYTAEANYIELLKIYQRALAPQPQCQLS